MAKYMIVLTVISSASLASAAGDILVRFYTGTTTNQYTDYPVESAEEAVSNSAWDTSKPVVLYAHGLGETVGSESTTTIVTAFLKRGDHNVIAIDYAPQAKYSGNIVSAMVYLVIQTNVVGESIGQLINRFVAKGIPVSSFYLIGYSTGAHVVGRAGRINNGLIPRITALDPILHGWFLFGTGDHLRDTDARVVDVIHSNGVVMGVSTALGTADFYPNSGYAPQPGCPLSLSIPTVLCNSDIAWRWFTESVSNPEAFKAIPCNSWNEFQTGTCRGTSDYMGYGFSQNTTGIFYLQTNSNPPYSKGDRGIIYAASA